MEIHAPERPIHSIKEFLMQLLTVTVGILIALSLEGMLEWSHHRALVREAKENLRQEMQDNSKELDSCLSSFPELARTEQGWLKVIEDLQHKKPLETSDISFKFSMSLVSNASWNTAQAAGALAYMRYDDVQKYATLYDLQQKFNALQDRVLEGLATVGPGDDPDKLSPRDLLVWKQRILTGLAQQRMAEDFAKTLKKQYEKMLTAKD